MYLTFEKSRTLLKLVAICIFFSGILLLTCTARSKNNTMSKSMSVDVKDSLKLLEQICEENDINTREPYQILYLLNKLLRSEDADNKEITELYALIMQVDFMNEFGAYKEAYLRCSIDEEIFYPMSVTLILGGIMILFYIHCPIKY